MPDVFADIADAPQSLLEMIAHVLELRAAMPQQQEMQRTYLRDIEFPDRAKVLEIGCGTGAIARVLAGWPRVGQVTGVDPSPYLIERARTLGAKRSNLAFEVGDGRALDVADASVDVVILHTVLTHVEGPERILAEAHRVLRPRGWLGVCDGDFSSATLATGDLDPLEVCVHAFVDGFVQDRWLVRRVSALAAAAGFEVSPLRSYGLLETAQPGLTLTWVDRGTDVLVKRGRIGPGLAAALKDEAKRRAEAGAFFGYMAYASLVGRKPQAGR
jgi:ubiquinone/menaquinone biosynthesis C-methylase UbiE